MTALVIMTGMWLGTLLGRFIVNRSLMPKTKALDMRRSVIPQRGYAQAELRTKLINGKPGSGKSTGVRNDILSMVQKNDRFVLVGDPHGSLADDVLCDLLPRGFEERIEVLDLADPSKVFGVDVMPYPAQEERGLWLRDEDRSVEAFATILSREQANEFGGNPMAGPMKGLWTRNILRLRMRQKNPVSLRFVPYALLCGHPIQHMLLNGCWDEKLAFTCRSVFEMTNVVQRDMILGATQRLVAPFFENPCVDGFLSVAPVDWYGWMREKKVVIVKSSALVSEAATRGVLCALNQLCFQTCAQHFAKTSSPLLCDVVLDEALRLKIGKSEADQSEQGRKYGYGSTYIVQRILDDEEFKAIIQSCQRLEIYAQGNDEATELAAKEIASLLFDSRQVKNVERRERQILRGYKESTRTVSGETILADGSKTSSKSVSPDRTPEYETVIDESKTFVTPQEFVGDWKVKIRKLRTGQRFVIDGNGASETPETVVPLARLWTNPELAKARLAEALNRIRSRSHYQTPSFEEPKLNVQRRGMR